MVTAVRTDIHRPSTIRPEDYEFVDIHYIGTKELDIGEALANVEAMENIRVHMKATGGRYSTHRHGGTCHICGASALYLAVFHHHDTNKYIQCGEDCCEKMWQGDPLDFQPMRRAIKNALLAKAGKMKAQTTLAEDELSRAWELYTATEETLAVLGAAIPRTNWEPRCDVCNDHMYDRKRWIDQPCTRWECSGTYRRHEWTEYAYTRECQTLYDIVRKLVKWGSLSEKQLAFLAKLVHQIDHKAEHDAQRKAAYDAAEDCPAGRVTITGEVITTRVDEGRYGDTLKMLVKAPSGYTVWGTVPSSLALIGVQKSCEGDTWTEQRPLKRGDKVEFTATVTPSDRDAKFGTYKRPTKARLL